MAEKRRPTARESNKAMREEEGLRRWAERIERQLGQIRKGVQSKLRMEYARGEVTGPQRLVMQELIRSGEPLSLKDLSGRVHLAHSTVSGILDRLESKGLVDRAPDEEDRRITRVQPSRSVQEFMSRRTSQPALDPMLAALRRATDAELRAVRRGIGTLARLMGVDEKGCGE